MNPATLGDIVRRFDTMCKPRFDFTNNNNSFQNNGFQSGFNNNLNNNIKFNNESAPIKMPEPTKSYTDNFYKPEPTPIVMPTYEPPKIKPIGSQGSGFESGSFANIRKPVDPLLDQDNPLQERYDFSGHGGHLPHLNYDLPGIKPSKLGPAHNMPLHGFDRDDVMPRYKDPLLNNLYEDITDREEKNPLLRSTLNFGKKDYYDDYEDDY